MYVCVCAFSSMAARMQPHHRTAHCAHMVSTDKAVSAPLRLLGGFFLIYLFSMHACTHDAGSNHQYLPFHPLPPPESDRGGGGGTQPSRGDLRIQLGTILIFAKNIFCHIFAPAFMSVCLLPPLWHFFFGGGCHVWNQRLTRSAKHSPFYFLQSPRVRQQKGRA